MKKNYRTIHEYGVHEIIINKSRFIGYAKPVESEEDAIKFIEEIKYKHKDATHNVPAYVIGENNNIQRYSDDGEPSGTAGIPILEVLKKENLRNVVIVVTRYYGGVKLGTGGLVRAYIKGAKIALEASRIVEKILHKRLKVRVDYTFLGKVQNDLISYGYIIDETVYDDAANLILLVKSDKFDYFKDIIIEITNAKVEIEEIGEQYFSVIDGSIIK